MLQGVKIQFRHVGERALGNLDQARQIVAIGHAHAMFDPLDHCTGSPAPDHLHLGDPLLATP
jgi:hypothetical protein